MYELKAMADIAGPDQGRRACSDRDNHERSHVERLHDCKKLTHNGGQAASVCVDCCGVAVVPEDCSTNVYESHLHDVQALRDIPFFGAESEETMHESSDVIHQLSRKFCLNKSRELLRICDGSTAGISVRQVDTDVVKSLTIEIPQQQDPRNIGEETHSHCGGEASMSMIMYFSERDRCRPLGSPPEEEEHHVVSHSEATSHAEEEKKKKKVGASKPKTAQSKASKMVSAEARSGLSQADMPQTAGSHVQESTGSGNSTVQPGAERGRLVGGTAGLRGGSARSPLAIIPESRLEEARFNRPVDRVEAQPAAESRAAPAAHFQGQVAAASVAAPVGTGRLDENQNKTTWRSVLQTNLGDKIDMSAKDGSSAPKDAQKFGGGFMTQVFSLSHQKSPAKVRSTENSEVLVFS